MKVSFCNMQHVKREAKKLRLLHPDLSHSKLLSLAAINLFGVRGFHELNKLREQTINQYLVGTEHLAKCTYCGLEFCPDVAADRKTHRVRHDAYEEATGVLNYAPQQYADREAGKKNGYAKMHNDLHLEQKTLGALMVIQAWFDRSLDAAIDGKYWKKHPSFEQYIGYIVSNLEAFPNQVVDALIQRYGRTDGVIPNGQTYWYPLKH